jgi:lipopolysaccharide assembly outer membrane protein LptD (OstA)
MAVYFSFSDKRMLIFFLAAILCLSRGPASAAACGPDLAADSGQASPSGQPAPSEWKIMARYYERTEERLFASGDVEVHYGDMVLFADRVEIMVKTKDVRAEGNVVLQYPSEVIKAESLTFNPDTSRGLLEKAQGMVQPSMLYQAEKLERLDPERYVLNKAWFTSCSQPVPRWRFSCSKATLKKNEYIEMWNSVFQIKDIPVFYLPYLRYPLGRRTGFLMPQPDYTVNKGFQLNQDFYWAMARNMDATFKLSYYSTRGFGLGVDYRYLFADGTAGNLMLRSFFFKKDESGQQLKSALIIRGGHNQTLPFGFSLVGVADYSSSIDFLREFDNDFNQATVSNLSTQLYLSRAWPLFNFSARVSRFETHFPDTGRSILMTYFPQLSFDSFKIKLFQPLYFSLSSSFNRWHYGWDYEFDQGTERRLQSLSFSPVVSLPFSSIPWLTVNAALGANLNYYWQRLVPDPLSPGQTIIADKPFFSQNFVATIDLLGPVFYRMFEGPDGTARVKHIIEPSLSYRYESPTTSSDMIVTSHGFFRYHQVVWGLTNHILVKEDRMPREWFTFGLAQALYLSPEESPLRNYRVYGRIPRVSEISSYLRFFPAAKFSLDFAAGYNPYHRSFSTLRLGASLGSPADSFFMTVNWFKSTSGWVNDPSWDRHQINVAGTLNVPRLSLKAQAEVNINLLQKELQHLAFQVLYDYQCLVIKAGFMYFQYRSEIVPILRVSLGDIGGSEDFLANPRL